jgi:hypothetical protein
MRSPWGAFRPYSIIGRIHATCTEVPRSSRAPIRHPAGVPALNATCVRWRIHSTYRSVCPHKVQCSWRLAHAWQWKCPFEHDFPPSVSLVFPQLSQTRLPMMFLSYPGGLVGESTEKDVFLPRTASSKLLIRAEPPRPGCGRRQRSRGRSRSVRVGATR